MLTEERLRRGVAEALRRRFYARYEQIFGRGSSYAGARLEIVTLRLRASAATRHPKLAPTRGRSAAPSRRTVLGKRKIYWAELKRAVPSPIYDGALLVPGNWLPGPAVIETTDTTVVVHPGRTLAVDPLRNFEIRFAS
jgi:N-methylhydantoinase A/oxoprolinase/acetone carboxylase beta subunit